MLLHNISVSLPSIFPFSIHVYTYRYVYKYKSHKQINQYVEEISFFNFHNGEDKKVNIKFHKCHNYFKKYI